MWDIQFGILLLMASRTCLWFERETKKGDRQSMRYGGMNPRKKGWLFKWVIKEQKWVRRECSVYEMGWEGRRIESNPLDYSSREENSHTEYTGMLFHLSYQSNFHCHSFSPVTALLSQSEREFKPMLKKIEKREKIEVFFCNDIGILH